MCNPYALETCMHVLTILQVNLLFHGLQPQLQLTILSIQPIRISLPNI